MMFMCFYSLRSISLSQNSRKLGLHQWHHCPQPMIPYQQNGTQLMLTDISWFLVKISKVEYFFIIRGNDPFEILSITFGGNCHLVVLNCSCPSYHCFYKGQWVLDLQAILFYLKLGVFHLIIVDFYY